MKRSLALVYVLGLFLLGILIGGLAMHLYYAQRFPGRGPGVGPPPHGRMGPPFLERLEHQLELSAEQSREIDEILREGRADFEEMRREMRPRLRERMERTNERIVEVLTTEQREKFEQMRRHRGRGMERFFLGR